MAFKNLQPVDPSSLLQWEDSAARHIISKEDWDKETKLVLLRPFEAMGEGMYMNWNISSINSATKVIRDPDLRSLLGEERGWKSYGVCDDPQQFLDLFGEDLKNSDRWFCVSFSLIEKANEPKCDGWRWEKWGPYIGNKESRADYLADEPDIDHVVLFQIYEMPSPSNPDPEPLFKVLEREIPIK